MYFLAASALSRVSLLGYVSEVGEQMLFIELIIGNRLESSDQVICVQKPVAAVNCIGEVLPKVLVLVEAGAAPHIHDKLP